jgi:hypothetical protein
MKLYSGYYGGSDPFGIFSQVVDAGFPTHLNKDGALILWGGEDISPSIYDQVAVHARANNVPSNRDRVEMELFKKAVDLGIPIIGICRGAQLGCCLSGGSLYQHLHTGHHQNHLVETIDGRSFPTSSCHHQALDLTKLQDDAYELLAWDYDRETTVYTEDEIFKVIIPEVVHFPKTKLFAIQGHPEWMNPKSPFVKWCSEQIKARYF